MSADSITTENLEVNMDHGQDMEAQPPNTEATQETESDKEQRIRTLSEKGKQLYESQSRKHAEQAEDLWNRLIQDVQSTPKNENALATLNERIITALERYRRQKDCYVEFLTSQRTAESMKDLDLFTKSSSAYCKIAEAAIDTVKSMLSSLMETGSVVSERSSRKSRKTGKSNSQGSSGSVSTIQMKRAAAEAALAKVEFAKKGAMLQMQEADIDQEVQRKTAMHKAEMEQTAIQQKAEMEQKASQQKAEMEQKASQQKAEMELIAAEAAHKKAKVKAEIQLLQTEQDAAVAMAEANVLAAGEDDSKSQNLDDLSSLPKMDPLDIVQTYVTQQIPKLENPQPVKVETIIGSEPVVKPKVTAHFNVTKPAESPRHVGYKDIQDSRPRPVPATTNVSTSKGTLLKSDDYRKPAMTVSFPQTSSGYKTGSIPSLNCHAPEYVPTQHRSTTGAAPAKEPNTASDITKFLLRKDLLFSRLSTFNDKAESYQAWKNKFKCVVNELEVSDSEELDLLVKWLGNESARYAVSIQASSIANPSEGLRSLWERLDERYGAPEMVEESIKQKLGNFPNLSNKDNRKLYELSDLLSEIQFIKENPEYHTLLGYFDTSSGIKPIVSKLPYGLQEKWVSTAANHMKQYGVTYPPFSVFLQFIKDISKIKNNPGLMFESSHTGALSSVSKRHVQTKRTVSVHKTDTEETDSTSQQPEKSIDPNERCILHKSKHTLNECRKFKAKPIDERKKILKENNICYKCCRSNSHISRDCQDATPCSDCNSKYHATALHIDQYSHTGPSRRPFQQNGGEPGNSGRTTCNTGQNVNSTCTDICGDPYSGGKSCAKILPVDVFRKGNPSNVHRMYAIIDDQSNRCLAASEFFDVFNIDGPSEHYTLTTCSGKVQTSGRVAHDFVIKSVHDNTQFNLPKLIECDSIPHNRNEIPTPEVAAYHSHLKDLAGHIPPLDDHAEILLLLGRTLPAVHHVIDQRLPMGSINAPYAQKLSLGWVVIGEVCLDGQHISPEVDVKRTYILQNGRPSTIMRPCPNQIDVQEWDRDPAIQPKSSHNLGANVFERTPDDDKPGLSQDDRQFISQMDTEFKRDKNGSWVAPLPFCSSRRALPNNKAQAMQRAKLLDKGLRKNPKKWEHFHTFMAKIIDSKHAEVAPELTENEECWYLPLFGVYHPKKPDQIRGVFDSSATFDGVSLNNVLLTGPDLANSLLGVLLRFRKDMIAITADIQSMFHCFIVREDHRNYLRFLWYKDNDISKELIEYRMRVHVFGNSPSPAVANLGLRKTALEAESKYGKDVVSFVTNDFYVDDGRTSCSTPESAIKLIKDTQSALMEFGNLRLHKFASNSPEVMAALPQNDLASNLKDLDLDANNKPLQRSLGLTWDVNTDQFLFILSTDEKPVTRRGILPTINSIYDPLGFLAPVIIYGKMLLRNLVAETVDWDEPVSDQIASDWAKWKDTLKALETIRIPRPYVPHLSKKSERQLHVFSDASQTAIAAVAYIRTIDEKDTSDLGFILGKAKLAPTNGHTIPRLELCAAVLAVEIAQTVVEQLRIDFDSIKYYTDSKVVLGYICNNKRRFFIYVANRVEKIRKLSIPDQWNYVPTEKNPADAATRSILASELQDSDWLQGPKSFLELRSSDKIEDVFELVDPECDKEIRSVQVFKTQTKEEVEINDFEQFETWNSLVEQVATLGQSRLHGNKETDLSVEHYDDAKTSLFRQMQAEVYSVELDCIHREEALPKKSPIRDLNPFIDERGLLRVGGRIDKSDLSPMEKRPLIIPGRHYLATLLVKHHHEDVKHQGRHFTEGAIRAAGLWITGARRLISSIIHKCVECRKLRGKFEGQIMSSLPRDRLEPTPPFTNVGVDAFGPWTIVTRRTRGGSANSKRWAILFTCLVTRAVHIELVEEMSSSAFINALKRFTSIRGKVKIFRSDRGTNFIGAVKELSIEAINVEDEPVQKFLRESDTVWIFNPPHSSHMGGVWERMIGVTRRILDSMLLGNEGKTLTHDVLNTFMAEATAIINSRPLIPVSSDPENPLVLTPNMLLTQKTDYVFSVELSDKRNLCLDEWKRVQALANIFWTRWKKEYLPTLMTRQKWTEEHRDLEEGDTVLLKDNALCRTQWPVGIIVHPIKGADGHVRSAEVQVQVDGKPTVYTRPITELILLQENDEA